MIKKLLFTLSVIILFGSVAYSQSTIKGSVKNAKGVPNSGVMVVLKSEDRVVNGAYTDDKGEYQIFGVSAGTYDIVAGGSGLCLNSQKQSGVPIGGSEIKFIDFTLDCSSTVLETVEIVYEAPIFDADNTKSSDVISGADVRKQAGRSISAALANLAGVSSVDGSISAVRGNRPDGQQMIIDGVRVRGGSSVSMQAIEGAELIQGGIPAEYGDGTSFTVITTKGVSREYHGSAELRGSLEGYNNFLAAVSLSGPIMRSKLSETDPARVGFLITAEGNYDQDNYPARGGLWVANDDLIESLTKNPLRYDQLQLGATYNNAEYLTNDGTNFYRKRVRENVASWGYVVQGKLDFLTGGKDANGRPKNNMKISIGASYQYGNSHGGGGQSSALFNSANNPISTSSTLRLNARINHRVKTATAGDTSLLKNLMYDININYTLYNAVSEDARHKDNFFNYGHIGKFTTKKAKMYLPVESLTDPDGIVIYDVNVLSSVYDSIITFDGSNSSNPDLAWYTQNFVDNYTPEFFYDLYGSTIPYDRELYQQFGSLLNGNSPPSVYGMFNMPGSVMSSYGKSTTQSIGAKASLSMSLGNHEVKLGFEFEKLTSRSWSVAPYSLWTLMRAKQNSHMLQLDVNNPIYLSEDTITYNQLVDLSSQNNFDRNLRIALGLDPNGSDWLDIDSYDPSTFDLSMFSADELLVGTSGPLVSYYGYDYTGSSINRNKTNISEFFDGVARTDNNGNIIYDDEGNQIIDRNYAIGAYEPVYLAMYIQDKFSIKSMLFNVGVRVDRFDANQQVLSDPFLFREAHTVSSLNGAFDNIVANAEGDWVVYVDQKGSTLDPATQNIIGYRSGTTWYDAAGQEVTDPTTLLGANGGPILKEAFDPSNISKVSGKAFEDYKPQWSVMPRISFSFPVSDNSLFYAHYNIISYRPSNLQLDPINYLFIEKFGSSAGYQVNNPNLKPQRSIDYELGFRQKVGNNAAISLAAYYSEKRDQIQSYRYTGAYPSTYYSYDNIDFGTVQGFSLGFNLRAKKFVNLRATYTIQFAKGTGSSAGSNLAIIASGQPNLRTLTNLEFDQRHRITADLSFDFEDDSKIITEWVSKKTGKKKSINWFQNAGASIRFSAASGMPYSRSSVPFSTISGVGKSQLSGSINGSNKPWIFQCDLRIYKSWILNLAKKPKTEGEKRKMKPGNIMVYLDVMNLFNFKNVLSVYTYTGNPEDDGYLSAAQYQQNINQQVYVPGYIDYYKMVMQSPYNYSLPTRVSLGVQFGF